MLFDDGNNYSRATLMSMDLSTYSNDREIIYTMCALTIVAHVKHY